MPIKSAITVALAARPEIVAEDHEAVLAIVLGAHRALATSPPLGATDASIDAYFTHMAGTAVDVAYGDLVVDRRAYLLNEQIRVKAYFDAVKDRVPANVVAPAQALLNFNPQTYPAEKLWRACKTATMIADIVYAAAGIEENAAPAAPRPSRKPSTPRTPRAPGAAVAPPRATPRGVSDRVFFPSPWTEAVSLGVRVALCRTLMENMDLGTASKAHLYYKVSRLLAELAPALVDFTSLYGDPNQPGFIEVPKDSTPAARKSVDLFLDSFVGGSPTAALQRGAIDSYRIYPDDWTDPQHVALWLVESHRTVGGASPGRYTLTLDAFLDLWEREATATGAAVVGAVGGAEGEDEGGACGTSRAEVARSLLGSAAFALDGEMHLIPMIDYAGGAVAAKIDATDELLGLNGGPIGEEEVAPSCNLDPEGAVRYAMRVALTRQRDYLMAAGWLRRPQSAPSWGSYRSTMRLSEPFPLDILSEYVVHLAGASWTPGSDYSTVSSRVESLMGYAGPRVLHGGFTPSMLLEEKGKLYAGGSGATIANNDLARVVGLVEDRSRITVVVGDVGGARIVVPYNLIFQSRGEDIQKLYHLGVPDEVQRFLACVNETTGRIPTPSFTPDSIAKGKKFDKTNGRQLPGVAFRDQNSRNAVRNLNSRIKITSSGFNLSWNSGYPPLKDPFKDPAQGYSSVDANGASLISTFWWLDEIPWNRSDIATDRATITPGVQLYPNPFWHSVEGPTVKKLLLDSTLGAWMSDNKRREYIETARDGFIDFIDKQPIHRMAIERSLRDRTYAVLAYAENGAAADSVRWGPTAESTPPGPGQTPDEHQEAAARFVSHSGGGLIMFDTGVGKTLSAIRTLAEERQSGRVRRPIFVVPKPLIPQWLNNINMILPDYRVGLLGAIPVAAGATDAMMKRLAKAKNPLTGAAWAPLEIAAILDNGSLAVQNAAERVEVWRQFAEGAYDVLLCTPTAFAMSGIDPDFVYAFVSTDHPIRRYIDRQIDRPKKQKVWEKTQASVSHNAWADHVTGGIIRDLIHGAPSSEKKYAKALQGTYSDGIVPEPWDVRFRDAGIDLDGRGKPIDPGTRNQTPFTPERAKEFASKPKEFDPVWFGAAQAPAGIVAVPCDLLVLDEAHAYKGLYAPEPRGDLDGGKVAFLASPDKGSSRAWNMLLRTAAVRAGRADKHGVVALTATPAKASPIELFNVLQLTSSADLEARGINDPEAFITQFVTIKPKLLADNNGNVERRLAAVDVERDTAGLVSLMQTVAIARTATDVPRLAGKPEARGDNGATAKGESYLSDPDINVAAIKRLLTKTGVYLRIASGTVAGNYFIRDVEPIPGPVPVPGGRLIVSPPFQGDAVGERVVRWEIRVGAKVPVAPPIDRVVTLLSDHQRAIYEIAEGEYAAAVLAGRTIGTSIVANLLNLSMHPALVTFGTNARGTHKVEVRVRDVDPDFLLRSAAELSVDAEDAINEAVLNGDDAKDIAVDLNARGIVAPHGKQWTTTAVAKVIADFAAEAAAAAAGTGDDEDDPDDAAESEGTVGGKADKTDAATNKNFVDMIEKCLLPTEPLLCGARSKLGMIDPAASPKLLRLADMLIDTMIDVPDRVLPDGSIERGNMAAPSIPCGNLVFVEGVQIHALLLILLRRKIEERKVLETARLRALGTSEADIEKWTYRLSASRVAIMNGPVTGNDPNVQQRIAEGFNGKIGRTPRIVPAHTNSEGDYVEEQTVLDARVDRFPAYDILIANKIANEGWDLQARTCTIHMLDLPWEPGAFVQRMGRAIRQGNVTTEVKVYVHLANGTLDYYRLQRVEGRRNWLTSLLAGATATAKLDATDEESQIAAILSAVSPTRRDEVEKHARAQFIEVRQANAGAALRAVLSQITKLQSARALARFHNPHTPAGLVHGVEANTAVHELRKALGDDDVPVIPWAVQTREAVLADRFVLLPPEGQAAKLSPLIEGASYSTGDNYRGPKGFYIVSLRQKGTKFEGSIIQASHGNRTFKRFTEMDGYANISEFVRDYESMPELLSDDAAIAAGLDGPTLIAATGPNTGGGYTLDEVRFWPQAWVEARLSSIGQRALTSAKTAMEKHWTTPVSVPLVYGPAPDASVPFNSTAPSTSGLLILPFIPTPTSMFDSQIRLLTARNEAAYKLLQWLVTDPATSYNVKEHPARAEYATKLAEARLKLAERYTERLRSWQSKKALHDVYVTALGAWTAEVDDIKAADADAKAEVVAANAAAVAVHKANAVAAAEAHKIAIAAYNAAVAAYNAAVAAKTAAPPMPSAPTPPAPVAPPVPMAMPTPTALPPKPATVNKPGPEPVEPEFADPVWPADPEKPTLLPPTKRGYAEFLLRADRMNPGYASANLAAVVKDWFGGSVVYNYFTATGAGAWAKAERARARTVPTVELSAVGLTHWGIDVAAWDGALKAASRPLVADVADDDPVVVVPTPAVAPAPAVVAAPSAHGGGAAAAVAYVPPPLSTVHPSGVSDADDDDLFDNPLFS